VVALRRAVARALILLDNIFVGEETSSSSQEINSPAPAEVTPHDRERPPRSSYHGGPMNTQHFTFRRIGIRRLSILAALVLAAVAALASRIQGVQTKPAEEISTHDVETPFKLQTERNLVMVRVVVRDAKGAPVSGLGKGDFQIYDRGKLQDILHFSAEKPDSMPAGSPADKGVAPAPGAAPAPASTHPAPLRFVALYFDDVHTALEGMQVSRNAADHYLATSLRPGDRVGLFTSSGRNQVDFTDDIAKLHQALFDLRPSTTEAPGSAACAEISPYQAYLIVKGQKEPLDLAVQEAICRCGHQMCGRAVGGISELDIGFRAQMENEAYRIHDEDQTAAHGELRNIETLIRGMTLLPGHRSVVIVSGGFLTLELKYELDQVIDRALRANVILNALDARGLYQDPGLVESQELAAAAGVSNDVLDWKRGMMRPSAGLDSEVMAALAEGTGGVFYENNNDFEAGFRLMASVPDAYYVLAFSPQNMKLDGAFHSIKVKLVSAHGLTLEARRGYYAPQNPIDPVAREREEMKEAVFSQEELQEIPVEVHTKFFMKSRNDAQLDVLTRFGVQQVHFRKQNDLNLDNLTCTTALFDRDGHLVTVLTKSVEMKLRDQTLASLLHSGATLRTRFEVKPGTYFVRTVLRDSESGQISSLNSTVDIPF